MTALFVNIFNLILWVLGAIALVICVLWTMLIQFATGILGGVCLLCQIVYAGIFERNHFKDFMNDDRS